MASWFRKNLVLVAGIVLPVLLVVGFFLLQSTPRHLGDPPGYDFLVVAYRYDAQHPRNYNLAFEVREGRLQGRATPVGNGNNYPNRQHAALFRYEVDKNEFSEIAWDAPIVLDEIDEAFRFTVTETEHLQLDKASRSPDGYLFEYGGYRGNGGLLGELFGMGRRYDSPFVLEKEGAYFSLPTVRAQPYYYGRNVHFLGWVLKEEGSS